MWSLRWSLRRRVRNNIPGREGAEMDKWKVFIRQVCPECLCARNEVHTGLVGMMGQLGLAGTLVMGDKVKGGH